VGCSLGSDFGGIDRVGAARDDVLVEGILDVERGTGLAGETLGILALLIGSSASSIRPGLVVIAVR